MKVTEYPDSGATELGIIIDILRNGQLRERSEEFSWNSWVFDGSVRRLIFGQPLPAGGPMPIVAGVPERIENDEDGLAALEYLTGKGDAVQRAIALPRDWWKTLLLWLFNKWMESQG